MLRSGSHTYWFKPVTSAKINPVRIFLSGKCYIYFLPLPLSPSPSFSLLFSLFFFYTLSLFLFTTFGETFLFFSCIKPRISRSSILRRCKSSIAIKLERRLFVGLGSRFAAKEKRRNNSKALAVVREEFDLEARSKSKLFTVRFVAG